MPVAADPSPPAAGAVPLLSACLIVKNGAATLARCLGSVRDLADEIIVVDTGSTDGSQEVARGAGARVLERPWENDFSRARNQSLAAARGIWVLILDADEFLLPEARAALRVLLREAPSIGGAPAAAFNLVQKSTADSRTSGMLAKQVRLFPRRPDVRYEWPVHEQVATSLDRAGLPVIDTEIEIIHTGYSDPAGWEEKQRRNLDLLLALPAPEVAHHPLIPFLTGGAYLDLGDVASAYAHYEECRRRCSPESELERGARVRLATCLVKLKRFAEAIAVMPPAYDPSWHPELLVLRSECEAQLGRPDEARLWSERTLACSDHAFIPPCDLAAEKSRALLALGSFWKKRGRLDLGANLLRAALAYRKGGRDFTAELLAQIYREFGVV